MKTSWITLPPWTLAQKAVLKVRRQWQRRTQSVQDLEQTSFAISTYLKDTPLHRYFQPLPPANLHPYKEQIKELSGMALQHRFDLLGSGWVNVRHGMTCRGMEGHVYPAQTIQADPQGAWLDTEVNSRNREESRRIWRLLYASDPSYIPIDWQIDFKSGYRWTAMTWYQKISYGEIPGVDIKLPWELARMQHGVQLAWAYALSKDGDKTFLSPERYAAEFRSQILDFMASNPPRFGVNWRFTMDVAIRIANWLAAYDLFRSYGHCFDSDFESLFQRSVYEHAWHIRHNLEWDPDYRGNHYLADIVGLLYAASYLPDSSETTRWRSLAAQELIHETRRQFHPEGSNFEASVCYHRLAAELCVYGTALATRIGISFPNDHFQRIEAMTRFTRDVTKPNGQVCQIGDNDNGRLFKMFPACAKTSSGEWQENPLNHLPVEAEVLLVRSLASQTVVPVAETLEKPVPSRLETWDVWNQRLASKEASHSKVFYSLRTPNFLSGLKISSYPAFGLYIFRANRFYLAVRCGSIGQKGHGGHAHNDQLSIELQVDGLDIFRDPGSYVYTARPDLRNQYRSVRAHAAPQGDREPGRLDLGLFLLGDQAKAECLYWGEKGFIGRHRGFGSWVYRKILFHSDGMDVIDQYDDERLARRPSEALTISFSPGYGRR